MAIAVAGTDVCAGLASSPTELDIGIAVDIGIAEGIVIGSPCIANSPASVASTTGAYASRRSPGLRSMFTSTPVITIDYIRMSVRTCRWTGIGVDRETLSERPHGCRVE